ncbi:hypothetical protein [Microbacterium candidum]|uniref:Uncharacterized protein n=1 Tax=Microbacterium candidum TaxID=3041922 RepID=A0ABT7N0I1_9MICO|nr:hypothetical protein [Microbacterium sp. ASV49]MDL9980192.1 hypothetical protein [Microbacterium sp. ASV49]
MPGRSGQAGGRVAAHRGRTLAVCIALHAVLLGALITGMVLDLVDGTRLGPMLIGAYVAASLVLTTAMFWPDLRRFWYTID